MSYLSREYLWSTDTPNRLAPWLAYGSTSLARERARRATSVGPPYPTERRIN